MNVWIPIEKISRCLDRKNTGRQEIFGNGSFKILLNRIPCALRQLSQQLAMKKEKNAEHFRNGKHHMAVWTRRLDSVDSQILQDTQGSTDPFWSPDSRFVGFFSDGKIKKIDIHGGSVRTGRLEVYAQSFPNAGNKVQISTGGGWQPMWRGDNQELFYVAPDRKIMSVDLKEGTTLEPGIPKALFQTEIAKNIEARNEYVVTSDCQLFLVNTPVRGIAAAPIVVFVNWNKALH